MKKKSMLMLAALMLVLSAFLAACSSDKAGTKKNENEGKSGETAEKPRAGRSLSSGR